MHVGLVIHMLNRSSCTLKGVWQIVSDIKTLAGFHDFADALGKCCPDLVPSSETLTFHFSTPKW